MRPKSGRSIIEVIIAAIALLMLLVLLLPFIQRSRESSRRNQCANNLVKIHFAIAAYHSDHGHFPIGTVNETGPIQSQAEGFHHNWLTAILPMLGESEIDLLVDRRTSVYAAENSQARESKIARLICPSQVNVSLTSTSYAGITSSIETPIDSDNDGVFRLNLPTTDQEIVDGLSHTAFLAEKLALPGDLGWMSGTRSSLRNGGHSINAPESMNVDSNQNNLDPKFVGGFASRHPVGAHVLFGDGKYQFCTTGINRRVLSQMCGKADKLNSNPDAKTAD